MVEQAFKASDVMSCDGKSDNFKHYWWIVDFPCSEVKTEIIGWKVMEIWILVESGLNAAEISLPPCPLLLLHSNTVKKIRQISSLWTNLSTSSPNIVNCSRQCLTEQWLWILLSHETYDQSDDPTWTTPVLDLTCASDATFSFSYDMRVSVKLACFS